MRRSAGDLCLIEAEDACVIVSHAEMRNLGFQRTLVLMFVVQHAGAAQRQLPVPPSLPSPAHGVALPQVRLPGVLLPIGSPLLDAAAPDSAVPDGVDAPQTPVSADSVPQPPAGPAHAAAEAHHPVDPPFYGRGNPSAAVQARTRKYKTTPEEGAKARAEFLRMAAIGQEIFNAPTWVEKEHNVELKKAIFAVAVLDEVLTDMANGQIADVPVDIPEGSDIFAEVVRRRTEAYERYARARADIIAAGASAAMKRARVTLERWHRDGLVSPAMEAGDAVGPEGQTFALYQKVNAILAGSQDATTAELKKLDRQFRDSIGRILTLRAAADADRRLKTARGARGPATPAEAKAIYDRSIREAKERRAENLLHVSARDLAARMGTVMRAPNVGKQIRPTCTMHMLQSLLEAMGVRRHLDDLIAEARAILNDPYVGMTTAFTLEQQLKLFRHYGTVATVKDRIFETLILHGRNLKVGIEIGDPVYKHSLLLEGFYELDGVTYVALRDSTSYFPTRMTLEDFARILTADEAVLFLQANRRPTP